MTDPNQVSYFSRLEAEECWRLLAEAEVGRVAWTADDGISIVPVNFRLEGHTVVFHTAPTSMLARLAEGAEVAFQADEIDRDSAIGWSVLVRGRTSAAEGEAPNVSWLDGSRTLGIAITPTTISGRVVSGDKRN